MLGIAFALTAITNLLDVVIMLVPVGVLLLLAVHHALWPLIKQPIYTLQRHHVFLRHKKLIATVGIALITVGGFGLPAWVEKLLGQVT